MDVCIYAITDTIKFRLPYTARHFEIRILVTEQEVRFLRYKYHQPGLELRLIPLLSGWSFIICLLPSLIQFLRHFASIVVRLMASWSHSLPSDISSMRISVCSRITHSKLELWFIPVFPISFWKLNIEEQEAKVLETFGFSEKMW